MSLLSYRLVASDRLAETYYPGTAAGRFALLTAQAGLPSIFDAEFRDRLRLQGRDLFQCVDLMSGGECVAVLHLAVCRLYQPKRRDQFRFALPRRGWPRHQSTAADRLIRAYERGDLDHPVEITLMPMRELGGTQAADIAWLPDWLAYSKETGWRLA